MRVTCLDPAGEGTYSIILSKTQLRVLKIISSWEITVPGAIAAKCGPDSVSKPFIKEHGPKVLNTLFVKIKDSEIFAD